MKCDVSTIKAILPTYGYKIDSKNLSNENLKIEIAISNIELYVRTWCNINVIPEELTPLLIEMVIGEFLYKQASNKLLTDDNMNFKKAITAISEGDTTVNWQYNKSSDYDIFVDLVKNMREGRKDILENFRRLRW